MVNMLSDAPPPIGHNKPPSPIDLLRETLTETYSAEIAKAGPIADRANKSPEKIETDEDLAQITEIALDARDLGKALDAARLNEQRPLVAVLKEVFEPAVNRCSRIHEALQERATVYNRAKAAKVRAEQQAEETRLREEAAERRKQAEIANEFGDTDKAVENLQEVARIESEVAAQPKVSAADATRVRAEGGGLATTRTTWKFEVTDYSKVDLAALRDFIAPAAVEKAIGAYLKIKKGTAKLDGVRFYEEDAAQFRR